MYIVVVVAMAWVPVYAGQEPAPAEAYEYFDVSGVGLEMPKDQVVKAVGRPPDQNGGDLWSWKNPPLSVEFGAAGTVKRVRGRSLRMNRGETLIHVDDSSAYVRRVLGPHDGLQTPTREGGFQRVWLRKTATLRITFDDKGYVVEVVLGLPRGS